MKPPKHSAPTTPPRVRREPPTIEEALVAAQGLTDDVDQQVEIAAALMGVAQDEVRPVLATLKPTPPAPSPRMPMRAGPAPGPRRVVVVERRSGRDLISRPRQIDVSR